MSDVKKVIAMGLTDKLDLQQYFSRCDLTGKLLGFEAPHPRLRIRPSEAELKNKRFRPCPPTLKYPVLMSTDVGDVENT